MLIAWLACRKTWHLGIRREHAKNQLFFFLRASVGTKHAIPASEISAKINVPVTDTMVQLMHEAEHAQETPVEFILLVALGALLIETFYCVLEPFTQYPAGNMVLACWCSPAFRKKQQRLRACQLYLALGVAACANHAFGNREDWRPTVEVLQQVWETDQGCLTVGAMIMHLGLKILVHFIPTRH